MTKTLGDLIEMRLTRRQMLGGAATTAAGLGLLVSGLAACKPKASPSGPSSLAFEDIAQVITDREGVAAGYVSRPLVRWGDPILPDAPAFEPARLDAAAQEKQFGYNCDFIAYFPLPAGSNASDHGLLVVNHEYTNSELMFPGWSPETHSPAQTAVEIAAHGVSVVEVERRGGQWRVVAASAYARRVTGSTPITLSGPAAGHDRLKTADDPTGARVLGTLNDCGGGTTPWGTALLGEENFHQYFAGPDLDTLPFAVQTSLRAVGIGGGRRRRPWNLSEPRFDYGKNPNEPNRFGWVVEVDPYDAAALPVKRTALGRFKHEGATTALAPDGRLVVYMGDDEAGQFLYRFVSRDPVDVTDPRKNKDLLDHGTLSVARFSAEGMVWLPLRHGEGPLVERNGFASQADVLIDTRLAAGRLGATPMDRPEDIEANPVNGRVYVVLTNNRRSTAEKINVANKRIGNAHGHILELVPPPSADGRPDHAADRFEWDYFILAGDAASGAQYGEGTQVWFSSPDNIAFDPQGRLWIATDQGSRQNNTKIPDGIYACDVDGAGRALVKFFYAVPVGAECCGPAFTPDGETLFLAVQHPGEGERFEDGGFQSTFEGPLTRWPDFDAALPPRPSVVAITKKGGGPIGS